MVTGTAASDANSTPSTDDPDRSRRLERLVSKHFLRRGHGAEFAMEAAWVRRNLPATAGCVADVGCGNGALLRTMHAGQAIGMDHNAIGLGRSQPRLPTVPLICAEAERLPLADASLDAIVLQHVVEHVELAEDACREWFRVLQPGGRLLLLTPNRSYYDPSVYADASHVWIFDRNDLRRIVTRVGFEILDLRTLGLPWFRAYHQVPGGWRIRRWVTGCAGLISTVPAWRWKGQTLCCACRRPAA
jgi:SAM-dependent methyltransferase